MSHGHIDPDRAAWEIFKSLPRNEVIQMLNLIRLQPAAAGDGDRLADERWDLAFIAEYPSAAAFLAMVTDPEYREHVKHRTAGVEDSRLIRLAPITPGKGFGE